MTYYSSSLLDELSPRQSECIMKECYYGHQINDGPSGLQCKKIVNCVLLPPVPSYCKIYQPLSDHKQKYRHCNLQTLPVSRLYPNLQTPEGITE